MHLFDYYLLFYLLSMPYSLTLTSYIDLIISTSYSNDKLLSYDNKTLSMLNISYSNCMLMLERSFNKAIKS